jgi:hypothetical protein
MDKKNFNSYTETFVVFKYGDYDISEIYTDKTLAEEKCKELNIERAKHKFTGEYKVMSLDSALDMIKEIVKHDAKYEGF